MKVMIVRRGEPRRQTLKDKTALSDIRIRGKICKSDRVSDKLLR